jgi:integrase
MPQQIEELCQVTEPGYRTPATPARRRGPCLARRTGQTGNVYQPHARSKRWEPETPAYGRVWLDTPNRRIRKTVTLGICPTRTIARQKVREYIEQQGYNSKERFEQTTTPGTSFETQANHWIESLPTRRRKPVKPATVAGWAHCLDRWLIPNLGAKPLSEVSNGAVRELVEVMSAAGLSPKTIVNNVAVAKMVVASAVNKDGEQIYPRTWNHDFIGLPTVNKADQERQTVSLVQLQTILANVPERFAIFLALIAGTGLRIGEVLGLHHSDFKNDCRVLHVQRSVWNGKPQAPKTKNAVRIIDIHDELAKVLREHVRQTDTYLFTSRNGTPLNVRNVLKVLHGTGIKVGFHALRRFRTETLRRARVPEDLIRFWLGHSSASVTDLYAEGLQNDEPWRRDWCDRAGLGFVLDGLRGYMASVAESTVEHHVTPSPYVN